MVHYFINTLNKKGHLHPELQGHFSEHLGRCIYEGLYVGENSEIPNRKGMRIDVVDALKEMGIPVLRWPGGCFADEYHWMDGIGPKEKRKCMVNTHWGGVTEDNSFGTHEFMELCDQLGCKNYINGNVGSGSVREMSEWVEYMTLDGISPMTNMRKENGREEPWEVNFFGVGNENWGCGGNMTPEYYGNLYRNYQTYVRTYDPKKPIFKIACGANADDYEWTRGVCQTCFKSPEWMHGFMDGISLHYYTVPDTWEKKGSATDFDEKDWYKTLKKTLKMEELIRRHTAILDQYDVNRKVGLIVDEWGTWYDVEPGTNPGFLYQQNTIRDALVAGINLNIFNKHCDRVRMANIAQLVNVLQAVILTDGEKMIKTPTYHVFHMYRHHQGADLLESSLTGASEIGMDVEYGKVPDLTESVSEKDGFITITLNNLSVSEAKELDVVFAEKKDIRVVEANIVSGSDIHDHNTFEAPETVAEKEFKGYTVNGGLKVTIPAASVVEIRVK